MIVHCKNGLAPIKVLNSNTDNDVGMKMEFIVHANADL